MSACYASGMDHNTPNPKVPCPRAPHPEESGWTYAAVCEALDRLVESGLIARVGEDGFVFPPPEIRREGPPRNHP